MPLAVNIDSVPYSEIIEYDVTVINNGTRNVYVLNGVENPELKLAPGKTYRFDLSDTSTSNHPFAFKTESGTGFENGVSSSGTRGSNQVITFLVPDDAPSELTYYCTSHAGMGNVISVLDRLGVALDKVMVGTSIMVDLSELDTLYGLDASDLNVAWEVSADRSVWSEDSSLTGVSPTLDATYQEKFVRASIEYAVNGTNTILTTDHHLTKPAGNNLLVGRLPNYEKTIVGLDSATFTASLSVSGELLSTTAVVGEAATFLAEEVSSDGFGVALTSETLTAVVNITDAVSVLKHIVGIDAFDAKQRFLSDLNGDEQVNISDAVTILKMIVGLESAPTFFGYQVDQNDVYTEQVLAENGLVEFQVGVLGDVDDSSLSPLIAELL